MENYNQTKNKLSKLWEQIQRNELNVAQIARLNINYKSANYQKGKNIYLIEENYNVVYDAPYYAEIKLDNWEASDSSDLKLVPVFIPFSKADYGIVPSMNSVVLFVRELNNNFYAFIYISVGGWAGQGPLLANFYLYINNWRDIGVIQTKQK